MYDYRVFLPDLTKNEINKARDWLKKKGVTLEMNPHLNIFQKPPWKEKILVSAKVEKEPLWPYPDDTIVSGFNLEVHNFDFDQAANGSKKQLKNLFGLLPQKAKGDRRPIPFHLVQDGGDREIAERLKLCKKDLLITDNYDAFGTYYFSAMFSVALARANNGLIWEGEWYKDRAMEEDFYPGESDINILKEDIEDGEKAEIFSGWF